MAEDKKPKRSSALAKLTPNATVVEINGEEIRVPADKGENANMNMLLISQGRAFIQKSIKRWNEDGETPSPKELKDLITAIKECTEASSAVYLGDVLDVGKPQKAVTEDKSQDEGIDFDKMPIEAKVEPRP